MKIPMWALLILVAVLLYLALMHTKTKPAPAIGSAGWNTDDLHITPGIVKDFVAGNPKV